MSWIKLDDGFADHPKVLSLGDRAFRMHVRALCWAGRFSPGNGHLPDSVIRFLGASAATVRELEGVGVWDKVPGGYQIHDFAVYNPDSRTPEEKHAAKVEAGRLGGLARASKMASNHPSKTLAGARESARGSATSKTLAPSRPVPSPTRSRPAGNTPTTTSSSSLPSGAEPRRDDDDDGHEPELPEGAVLILSALRLRRIEPHLRDDARELAEEASPDSIRAAIEACKADNVKPWPDDVRARLPRSASDDLAARKRKYLGAAVAK